MKVRYLAIEAPREGQASFVHVHEIMNGLEELGADIKLYSPSYAKATSSPSLPLRLFYSLLLQVRLWIEWPWDQRAVLYVRSHYLAFPSAFIAWLFRVLIVHEINGPYEDVFITHPSLRKFRKTLIATLRWQYCKASRLIGVTSDLVTWANKEGRRADSILISNGANTDLFNPDVLKPADAPHNYVIFFGGLARWHGVSVMLDAVNDGSWPKDMLLLIIGDGQEAGLVREAAARNPSIVFMGKKPQTDLSGYVAHAKASIVMISDPSQRSSTGVLPLKLFESLACGIPVIVSDLPGQADLVREHDCGYVVDVDDAAGLAQTVSSIRSEPLSAKEKGRKGRDLVCELYSWKAKARDTHDIIKALI